MLCNWLRSNKSRLMRLCIHLLICFQVLSLCISEQKSALVLSVVGGGVFLVKALFRLKWTCTCFSCKRITESLLISSINSCWGDGTSPLFSTPGCQSKENPGLHLHYTAYDEPNKDLSFNVMIKCANHKWERDVDTFIHLPPCVCPETSEGFSFRPPHTWHSMYAGAVLSDL